MRINGWTVTVYPEEGHLTSGTGSARPSFCAIGWPMGSQWTFARFQGEDALLIQITARSISS